MSRLIDVLPDEITLTCLANVPYYLYPKLELVSRSWKTSLRSVELFTLRQKLGLSENFLAICCNAERTWQLYDPVRKLWFSLTKFPSKTRFTHFGVVSTPKKIFVIGGKTKLGDVTFITNEVWSFDLITRTWSMLAPMLRSRAFFACCIMDGKIVVAGGFTTWRCGLIYEAEIYDIEKDVWVSLPDVLWICKGYCTRWKIGGKMHIDCNYTAQAFDNSELKWRVANQKWLGGEKADVKDSLYLKVLVPDKGYIILKQDLDDMPVFLSPKDFDMIGERTIERFVLGGLDDGPTNLHDVLVLNVRNDKPTYYVMPQCNELVVHGCTELRI